MMTDAQVIAQERPRWAGERADALSMQRLNALPSDDGDIGGVNNPTGNLLESRPQSMGTITVTSSQIIKILLTMNVVVYDDEGNSVKVQSQTFGFRTDFPAVTTAETLTLYVVMEKQHLSGKGTLGTTHNTLQWAQVIHTGGSVGLQGATTGTTTPIASTAEYEGDPTAVDAPVWILASCEVDLSALPSGKIVVTTPATSGWQTSYSRVNTQSQELNIPFFSYTKTGTRTINLTGIRKPYSTALSGNLSLGLSDSLSDAPLYIGLAAKGDTEWTFSASPPAFFSVEIAQVTTTSDHEDLVTFTGKYLRSALILFGVDHTVTFTAAAIGSGAETWTFRGGILVEVV